MNALLKYFLLYYLTWILLFILIAKGSAPDNEYVTGDNGIIKFRKSEVILLHENIDIVGNIENADVTSDGNIVIFGLKPPQFSLFARNGEQITLIGREGRGPFEYSQPSMIRYYDGQIYIYDASKLGFIIFNEQGEPLREELNIIRGGVRDVAISPEGYYFRLTGIKPNEIALYKPETDEIITIHKFQEREKENDMLSMLFDSGKIAKHENKLYFANVAINKVYIYNIDNDAIESVEIPDKDFSVPDLDFEIRSAQDLKRAEEYIFNNSRVRAIYTLSDFWIAEIENGRHINRTRTTKLFVYDYDNNLIDTIVLDPAFRKHSGSLFTDQMDDFLNILCNDDEHLYILTEELGENRIDILRKITVWKIERN